ncbi:hypothetical protein BHE74_00014338 [Ensete ventricosum]|nr:hypothetical protein BHE74_00014338 [Ensete ventricosum]
MKSFCHFCFLQVVTTPTRSLTLNLDRKENNKTHMRKLGKLNVCVNESLGSKTIMEIVFRCSELETKDLFSRSDIGTRTARYRASPAVTDKNVNKVFDEMLMFVRVLRFMYIPCTTSSGLAVTQLAEAKLRSEDLSIGQEDAEAGTLEEYATVLSFELS